MTNRQLFLRHLAQTSPAPMALEFSKAEGVYLFDAGGKAYLDFISGFSVMNLGHGQPEVLAAIEKQIHQYMHVMVYGEVIQSPQVQYAALLASHLPDTLDMVYFTSSGAEATEGAMKLAKRLTRRPKILAFKNAYHGSTQGALSILGDEYFRNAFRPLLPEIYHLRYNSDAALEAIDEHTACVVVEMVQAEAGAVVARFEWLQKLRTACNQKGVMLIADEIQTGFGRTGTLWAFEASGIVPDILLLGKALGGGMPLGAFISSRERMLKLTGDPVLGHITTFGGHPVSCAAGMASFQKLLSLGNGHLFMQARWFEKLAREILEDIPAVKSVSGKGKLLAVELRDAETCLEACHAIIDAGILVDWFLFAPQSLRFAPPIVLDKATATVALQNIRGILEKLPAA